MRHRKAGRHLRRTSEQRLALLRGLAMALVEHGAIETTEAKAKELRPFVEKLITKARSGTLHARRLAAADVPHRPLADKLFKEVGPQFADRQGGYTRILKLGHRKGDGADIARIELITAEPRRPKAAKRAAARQDAKAGAKQRPKQGARREATAKEKTA